MRMEPTREDHDIWDIIPDKQYQADQLLERKQADEHLKKSLGSLSPRDRMIFDLLYNKGVSPEDAGQMLGLTAAIIYSRKHRIIEKIKKSIGSR